MPGGGGCGFTLPSGPVTIPTACARERTSIVPTSTTVCRFSPSWYRPSSFTGRKFALFKQPMPLMTGSKSCAASKKVFPSGGLSMTVADR
jgi:hypothetical protein